MRIRLYAFAFSCFLFSAVSFPCQIFSSARLDFSRIADDLLARNQFLDSVGGDPHVERIPKFVQIEVDVELAIYGKLGSPRPYSLNRAAQNLKELILGKKTPEEALWLLLQAFAGPRFIQVYSDAFNDFLDTRVEKYMKTLLRKSAFGSSEDRVGALRIYFIEMAGLEIEIADNVS